MGWFDSQIKERLEHDEDLVSQAAWDLSVAITGRAAGGAEVDAGKAAADAVGEVLAYYRVKPADAPRDPKSVRDLIDAQLRGTGVMCRRVVLSKGWQRDAAGAMLGFVDGAPVALIPQPAGGFAYSDVATGEKVRVDRANAARLTQEAYCFYQPLPQRELGVRDVLLHMVRSLDLSDYVMIVAATLAVTLLGMLLPAVNSLIFGPVVDSGNVGVVVPIAVLLASVTCARVLIGGAKELVMSRVGTKLSLSVQAAAMMRTLSLPAPFYRAYASGDLSARLSSIETLASMLQNIVLTTGLTSVFSLAYVAQIAAYAPGLALPALGVILASAAVSVASVLVQVSVTKRKLEHSARRKGWEYALFTGIQKIRLAGAERRAYATWVDPFLPDDLHFPSARTEQPGHKRHPPIRILRAEQDQKTPDLLLEHDNQRDYPHADDLPEYHTEQFHIQHAGHDPQQVDNQDTDNDAQRIRPPCQPIHLKHNQRHHEDIDNIDQRNIQKSEAHSRNKGNKRMTKRQLFSQPPFYHAPKDLRTLTSQQALCGESGRMRSGSR